MNGPPRPPFGRGRTAARLLAHVIDGSVWVGCRIPAGLAHTLARVGGTLEWLLRPTKRQRLAVNLAHAVGADPTSPTVKRLVRAELLNEARRSADLLWALGRPDEFLATTTYVGMDHAQRTAAKGAGMILVGTHIGGWEVATVVPAAVLPVRTTVIVADDWLAWAIEHARVGAGLDIVYRKHAALTGARRLREGECLLLLADDGGDAGSRHRVRFLDAEAELAAGVATLARLAQSPVVGFTVLPRGRRQWEIIVDPPIPPPATDSGADGEQQLLQALADQWSQTIRAHPEHWSASYPIRWVTS